MNVDQWQPEEGSAALGFDEKGYRLPEAIDSKQLAEVRSIEREGEAHALSVWSEFLPAVVSSVLTKRDTSEPLGLRFHEVSMLGYR